MKKTIQRGSAARAGHDPRAAALKIIAQVLHSNDSSQAVLDECLTTSKLVPSDAGLCTELVYGYLRQSMLLSWHLNRLLATPDKLPAEMRLVLGLAAYELAFLRIPGYASVNWAVSRVKNRFGQGLAQVANGVLRTFQREYPRFTTAQSYAPFIADPLERQAVMAALPLWLVRLWHDHYGPEKAACYIAAATAKAVPCVRVNMAHADAEKITRQLTQESAPQPVGRAGLAFNDGFPYAVRGLARTGALSYQSAAVQEMLAALNPESWQTPVWDACAGRGGKTLALMEQGITVALATDTSPTRLAGLITELARLGFTPPPHQDARQRDAHEHFAYLHSAYSAQLHSAYSAQPHSGYTAMHKQTPRPDSPIPGRQLPEILLHDAAALTDKGPFGTIVLDVPCSGLGTLARRPEIRLRRNETDIAGLTRQQDAILDNAAALLSREGRIIYITCTLTPQENEERVAAFTARHPAFHCTREWNTPPDSPWHEFFYAACLQRRVV